MKLVVAGSTGFVATEVIRQALENQAITSIIGLARRETKLPDDFKDPASKFKSVVCTDFLSYPASVQKELEGAEACIWPLAVTPGKARAMSFEDSTKICVDYTMYGLKTMAPLAGKKDGKPFRFIYVSGSNAERDQSKKPWILSDYALMRGRAESFCLDYAQDSKGTVEAVIAKPGLITSPGRDNAVMGMVKGAFSAVLGIGQVEVRQIAAVLLDAAVNGARKDTFVNEELKVEGARILGN